MRRLMFSLAAALALPWTLSADEPPVIGGCFVFPADNIWNTPVDGMPVDPNSAAYVATIGSGKPLHPDFGSGLYQGAAIGIPFVSCPGTSRARP